MRCPNCGKHFDGGQQCPHCKIDAVLLVGTEKLSDKLYNKGLSCLNAQDISTGIRELTRAVHVNKHNIRARNLLGLALFEIGHIGEALKHWVISRTHLRENNVANAYLDIISKDARGFERLNEAVVLYNRALEFIGQASEDLAIIQLKKALEHNPRFVDALNLLALCYMQQRNRPQANTTLERVFTIDMNNPTATRYHNIINPSRPPAEQRARAATRTLTPPTDTSPFGKLPDTGPFKAVKITEDKPTYFHAVGIISFILGAVVMLAFVFFLYLPAARRENNLALQRANNALASLEAEHEEALAERDTTEQSLRDTINELRSEVTNWEARYNIVNHTNLVLLADVRFRQGTVADLRAAVDILAFVTLDGLSFDTVAIATHIRNAAYPQLAAHYSAAGIAGFNDGDYDRALILLEYARRFMSPDNQQFANVLYHLGTLLYRAPARREEAIAALQELTALEGYSDLPAPWSARRTRVETMLRNMGA